MQSREEINRHTCVTVLALAGHFDLQSSHWIIESRHANCDARLWHCSRVQDAENALRMMRVTRVRLVRVSPQKYEMPSNKMLIQSTYKVIAA